MWDSQCPFYINGLSGEKNFSLVYPPPEEGLTRRSGRAERVPFPNLYIYYSAFSEKSQAHAGRGNLVTLSTRCRVTSNPLRIMRNHTRNVENGVIGVARRNALTSFTLPIRYFKDEFFRWSGGRRSCWDKSCSEYCHEETSLVWWMRGVLIYLYSKIL